jgi:flagellar hook protein FlgE
MSLYGAMMMGIDGLDANANALSIYSSNIANVNTIGYKDTSAQFSTMLTQMMGGVDQAGVSTTAAQNNMQQGLLQQASSPTDLAVSGGGFFAVSANENGSGATMYTRAGNFAPNADGYLANGAGFYLKGWPIGTNGAVNSGNALSTINLNGLTSPPSATTTGSLVGNLNSADAVVTGYNYTSNNMTSGAITPSFTTTFNFTDSKGGTQQGTIDFCNIGNNQWAFEVNYSPASNVGGTGSGPQLLTGGTMTFNSDGSLQGITDSTGAAESTVSVNLPFTNGLANQTFALNLGTPGGVGNPGGTDGFTDFASNDVLTSSKFDGEAAGTLSGVTIGKDGIVTAQFSNGQTKKVFQIPLASFGNPNALTATSGDAWLASTASGSAIYNAPTTGAAGSIQSGALEGSTVDLATEFTNLITSQRAYSASARIVTTADQMLQTLEQLPST